MCLFLLDSEIYNQLGFLDELRSELSTKISHKHAKIDTKLSLIDRTKQSVFSKIDNFFNQIIQIAEKRKEQLKKEYLHIEEKERSHFTVSLDKIRQDSADLNQISQAFTYFYQSFDDAEDFNKNTENMYFYQASYQQLQKQIERKANFYKVKKFQPSEFNCIESDLVAVQSMGKIMDNSLADAPLVLFDSQKFSAFEYQAKGNSFQELPLIDTENFTERIPKDFKSIYVGGPEQSFLLVGGFDVRKRAISNAAYLYQKGKLKEVLEMYVPRQFFGICSNLMTELANSSAHHEIANQTTQDFQSDKQTEKVQRLQQQDDVVVFVVGGFNDSDGSLKQVESFSMKQQLWKKHSAMNVERINPGCCTFEKQYVYVFGGRSADARADFYDSIERLNTDLNLWSFIKIRLPEKLCNLYAFTVKKDYILILGGLKRNAFDSRTNQPIDENYKKPIKQKYIRYEQKVDQNVYMYSQSKQVWFNLRPLSKEMKVCNVIPTGDCRFNCFLLQKPSDQKKQGQQPQQQITYPLNIVYDLKIVCPRLDRYWYFDHTQKAKQRQMSKESNSVNFLNSVKKDQRQQDSDSQQQQTIRNPPAEGDDSARNTGDPFHSRNFEWERRQSNFRAQDFGQELPTLNDTQTSEASQSFTGESGMKMPTPQQYEDQINIENKPVLSQHMANFSRISLSLGKNSAAGGNLLNQEGNRNKMMINTMVAADQAAQGTTTTTTTTDPPPFGQLLSELGGGGLQRMSTKQPLSINNNLIQQQAEYSSDESEEDLISAFK